MVVFVWRVCERHLNANSKLTIYFKSFIIMNVALQVGIKATILNQKEIPLIVSISCKCCWAS